MTDEVEKEKAYFIRSKHVPAVIFFLLVGALCTGVSGIYAGSAMQVTRNSQELINLRKEKAASDLRYEQRLGTQSKQFADELAAHSADTAAFQQALTEIKQMIGKGAAERERSARVAIATGQKALAVAAVTQQTTDKILAKQDVVQQQVVEAKDAAKATETKIDKATSAPPASPSASWLGGRRH